MKINCGLSRFCPQKRVFIKDIGFCNAHIVIRQLCKKRKIDPTAIMVSQFPGSQNGHKSKLIRPMMYGNTITLGWVYFALYTTRALRAPLV